MELHIVTDRYGFRSIYYAQRGGRFLFASEMKAVCVADTQGRTLDEIGLVEQFLYGSPVMEKTWIQDYQRLGPAGIITASKTAVKIRKYWSYKYDESAQTFDQETYFTVYAKKLARAVERCMSGDQRKGIFLSGGYDSRAIAAAIHPSYLPMPAFTFGDKDSRDVVFGSQLADRLGFQHHVFHHHVRQPFLYDYCRKINWRTEGMLSFGHVTSIRNHDLFTQHMDVVLTGFLGEFNGSHTWPRLLLTRSRAAAGQVLYDHFIGSRYAGIAPIFQRSFLSRVTEGVNARFFDSVEQVDNDHPMNLADSWNLANVQPRGTFLSPVVDRHRFEIRTPHMDNDLVDFLLTIPPYSRLEQRVYKKMIAYAYPQIRDIACTNSAKPIDPRFFSEYTKMAGRYIARKSFQPIQRLLGTNQNLGRDIADRNRLFREEPKLMTDLMLPMLDKGIFDEHVFDIDTISSLVRDHYDGHANHWELISLLISWGLGASYFLYDDLSEAPEFVH
jgi:asparagine synthase (glutamine-hydrolysing)